MDESDLTTRVRPFGSRPGDAGEQRRSAIVLVVERDPHIRELERYFLDEAGFAAEFVADGASALELARRTLPAVVITEILVPKLDGLALCRAIKEDASLRHTAVLIFSILAAEVRAREAGADAFVMKPVAERRLVETVRELLARDEARRGEKMQ